MSTIELEAGAVAAVSKLAPDVARTKRRADQLVDLANALSVTTQVEYDLAASELRKVIAMHTELEAERVSFTKPLNDVLTRLNEKFQPYLKALRGDGKKDSVSAESVIKGKMAAFLVAEERRIADERRVAEEAARVERERLENEARLLREAEEARQAEERRVEEQRQADARAEQERLDAAAAELKGKAAKKAAEEACIAREAEEARQADQQRIADERREQAERAAAALETTAAVTIAQPSGNMVVNRGTRISTPKTYDFELTSMLDLIKYIAASRPDLIVLLTLNDAKVRALVKMMGAGTDLPGVRVFQKTGITVR